MGTRQLNHAVDSTAFFNGVGSFAVIGQQGYLMIPVSYEEMRSMGVTTERDYVVFLY